MKFRIIRIKGKYCIQRRFFIGWRDIDTYLYEDDAKRYLEHHIREHKNKKLPTEVIKEVEVAE